MMPFYNNHQKSFSLLTSLANWGHCFLNLSRTDKFLNLKIRKHKRNKYASKKVTPFLTPNSVAKKDS